MPPPSAVPCAEVLWIGDHRRDEFQASWRILNSRTRLSTVGAFNRGIELLEDETSVELVVLAQAFPGEFTARQVEALRRANPLVGLVALLGSWCEGESRSGAPWPGVARLYWHQFALWLERQLELRATSKAPHWAQPLTTSEEERFLAASERSFAVGSGVIAILSDHFDFSQMLADACRRQGWHTVEFGGSVPAGALRGVRAALWDGDPFDVRQDQLAALVAAVRPAPVIALMSFPRQDQFAACLAAGAAQVHSKPLNLRDLFQLLSAGVCSCERG